MYLCAVIAPFWTDIDTRRNGNSLIYYREDMGTNILLRASNDVREAFGREFALFRASWSFIATWHRVTFFGYLGSDEVAPVSKLTHLTHCLQQMI